jgi:outer membrane protein OmpA-like peptidoglycan-associated protein
MKKLLFLSYTLIFLATQVVNAQDADHKWALNLGLGILDNNNYTSFDGKLEDWGGVRDHSYGIEGSFLYYIGKGISVGAQGTYAGSLYGQKEYYGECGCLFQDLSYLEMWNALGTVRISLKGDKELGWFDPYLYADAGVTSFANQTGFTFGGGAGVNFWLSDKVGIYAMTSIQNDSKIPEAKTGILSKYYFNHGLGLAYRFGKKKDTDGDGLPDKEDTCPEVAGPLENDGCPWPDTDGDGLLDKDDACPEVAGPQENNGCPWPDTDGDGLLDKDDTCPEVAGPIENDGCPWPDTDGDGVLDKDDACLTVAGPIDNKGCPYVLELTDTSIFFGFDSYALSMESQRKLDRVAKLITESPENISYFVYGYTDNSGRDEYNLKLSEKRANAVEEYLISKGVQEQRIRSNAFGEQEPVDSNEDSKGRQHNRRVEIKQNKS